MRTATAIRFDDLTLGYGRHPAVHHLDGEIAAGQPDGRRRARTAPASRRCSRASSATLKPLAGHIERRAARRRASPICRRPPRSTAPSRSPVYDLVAMGLWSPLRPVRRHRPARSRPRSSEAHRGGRPHRLRAARRSATLSGGQMQRALFARLLLQDAPRDPARRAVHRHRRQDHRRPARPRAPLARRSAAPCSPCCTISTWCRRIFPQTLLHRARAGRLGRRPPRC